MRNIIEYLKTVKENLTNRENSSIRIALAQQMLYLDCDKKELFEDKELVPGVFYKGLKGIEGTHKQDGCCHNVPMELAEVPKDKEERKRTLIDPSKKFPILFSCSAQSLSPKDFAKGIVKDFLKTFRYISVQIYGKTIFVQQNQKGSAAYQEKQKWQIIDTCKVFDEKYKHCYFITLTMAQEAFQGHFLDAWKPFSCARNAFMEKMAKRYKGAYVWVNESTLKGFPHSHILFYTNKEFKDLHFHYNKKKHTSFIDGGELKEWVTKNWKLGFNQIDINRRKNTYNYLVKYIAKSAKADLKKLQKQSKIKVEEVKNLLTLVCPVATKTRGIGFSKLKNEELKSVEAMRTGEFSTSERVNDRVRKESEFWETAQGYEVARAYLKTLSTKSEISCRRKIGFYTEKVLEKEFSGKSEWANDFPEERKRKIHEKYAKAHCNGCLFSHLVDYYEGNVCALYENMDNSAFFSVEIAKIAKLLFKMKPSTVKEHERSVSGRDVFYLICQYLEIDGSKESSKSLVYDILRTNKMIWWFVFPENIRKKLIARRASVGEYLHDGNVFVEEYEKTRSALYNFLLTNSANGVIV